MKIHLIGIGGIGMSSLAQYYLAKGHRVSGSDLAQSEITDFLKEKGIGIVIGNHSRNIKEDFDLVVYSLAVKQDNAEYKKAEELGIKLKSYPEALGELTRQYFTVAVSGSHGKSTTTAMIGLILAKTGLDPTVIVGTKLKEFGDSNFRMGKSNFLVIEACEYDGSFLNYEPKIIVVTNIDKEHLDYFKTFLNVVRTFKNFILRLPKNGFLVANKDDPPTYKVSEGQNKFQRKFFSLKQKEAVKIKRILNIPGQHNVSNALAALAVARILDVKDSVSLETLSLYKGSWRRFEIIKTKPFIVISDYGHHPNEVLATLKSAREKYPNNPGSRAKLGRDLLLRRNLSRPSTTGRKKIWLIFQPHQYQRTYYLFRDFIKVFRQAPIDEIIITDIYDVAGREEKKISSSVNSKNLVEKINRPYIKYMMVDSAEKYIKKNIKSGDILIIMGAGDN